MTLIKASAMRHQNVSLAFLAANERVFDMSDAGTGKTFVEIVAHARRKNPKKMLVLCPRSLLHSVWEADFDKFAPTLKVSVAYAHNRRQALSADAHIYVTNHDAVKDLAKLPEAYWRDFDTLVVDECEAFKHHTSARSKALAKIVKHFKIRRLLSATPASNGICNLWHQVKLLDDGKRLGNSFFSFRAATCTPTPIPNVPRAHTWTEKPNAEAIVSALIADITIRHAFEDCVDIPANHKYTVPFALSKSHRTAYELMREECLLEFTSGHLVTAMHAAVLHTKLLQIASGAVYSTADQYVLLDTDRYELVMDLAEARDHTVVFFNWAHQKDMLVAEAIKRGMSYGVYDGSASDALRVRLVDQFQAGHLRVLFAHPGAAGHGLTLTRGVATIWASPTANLSHYLQGLKRIHRIGQRRKSETIMILADNTIEQNVYASLQNKDVMMSAMLKHLKEAA